MVVGAVGFAIAGFTIGILSRAGPSGGVLDLWPGLGSLVPPPSLDRADNWFLDLRLTTLRHDQTRCMATLRPPHADAQPIADRPLVDGCGWTRAVALRTAGGVRVPAARITCEMATALALWLTHDVQPAARRHFGQGVASVQSLGTYACRNMIGGPVRLAERSEHATANAIDIAAFVLADGRVISLVRHWKSTGPEAMFLREVHAAACRVFRNSLGPDYNAAHADHFHFDRGGSLECA